MTLHDPRHNRSRHSLHNHFLVKSLHLVRPGGLVVALTSRFTLDARNPAARREMAEMADLVGAVRLPEWAFRAVAGTDVVIDLLRAPAATVGPDHKEGSLLVTATGLFARVEDGVAVRFQPDPKNGAAELRAVIAVRDALHEVLAAQAASVDDPAWEAARRRLNVAYDSYLYRYGPLNRFTLQRTGRTHPETGETTYRRMTPKMGGFKADPDLPSVLALEMFDADTGHAAKAAIFERRVLEPRQRSLSQSYGPVRTAVLAGERPAPTVTSPSGTTHSLSHGGARPTLRHLLVGWCQLP